MSDVLQARRAASAKYQPDHVKTLLVAEAPPAADDRYFYFENVSSNDWLFAGVAEMVLGAKPQRGDKASALEALKAAGYFLIDLSMEPVTDRRDLPTLVPDLVDRTRALRPERVMLIKANVYDLCFEPLRRAGFPVVDERVPFPSTGQQGNFRLAFARAALK